MSVPLIIAGVTYNYPIPGDELWGPDATDWAIAVTAELQNLVVSGDLGPTVLVNILNNQASVSNVTSLAFDPATIRSAQVEYYVYRTFNSGSEEVVENGTMYLTYKDIANEWDMVLVGSNVTGSGVTFSITNAGQVQYVSSNLTPATSYSGSMRYRASVLQK